MGPSLFCGTEVMAANCLYLIHIVYNEACMNGLYLASTMGSLQVLLGESYSKAGERGDRATAGIFRTLGTIDEKI